MARPDVAARDNFFNFVTAHGPFELAVLARPIPAKHFND